jgi:hypothetical protein
MLLSKLAQEKTFSIIFGTFLVSMSSGTLSWGVSLFCLVLPRTFL